MTFIRADPEGAPVFEHALTALKRLSIHWG